MPPNNSGSQQPPFDDGSEKEKLNQYAPMEITDDTTNNNSKRSLQNERATLTVELAPRNKRMISSDKNNPSKKRIRTTKSSVMSGQASTSNERDCYGWWTQSCEEMSKKLWFPTETVSVDSPSTSLNGYVVNTTPVSWSKIKKYTPPSTSSQKTLWQSYTSSRVDTTVCAVTQKRKTPTTRKSNLSEKAKKIQQTKQAKKAANKGLISKCQKIRLHPTQHQALILRKWMKAARDTYNITLRLVKDKKVKLNKLAKKLVVTSREEDGETVKKMKETPANIRARAVLDLLDAYKSASAGLKTRIAKQQTSKSRWKTKKKKEKTSGRRRWKSRCPFDVKYKSKRLTSDSFGFEPNNIKVNNEFKQVFIFSRLKKYGMREGIKISESVKCAIKECCRVQYCYGRWYLLCPYKDSKPQEPITERFVALDGGVRTFQTYYTDNEAGEIGIDMEHKIDHINRKINGIESKLKTVHGSQKKRLRRAWYRCNARSSNLMTDFHWNVIKKLLDNFDVIIAPRLHVQSLIKTLPPIVKERILTQRHGLFSQRLVMKAKARGKTVITDFEEHGTSRTCSCCGEANHAIGTSKNFRCHRCGFTGDRDLNAARNHALKYLVGENNY